MIAAIVTAALLAYAAGLVLVARRAETPGRTQAPPRRRALFYALSLMVYCSSWAYFAAVGDAATKGWAFAAFLIGPALSLTLLFPLWRRIAASSKRERSGSIADFLASRYGKSRPLGILVTTVALIAALPRVALELKALAFGWSLLATGSIQAPGALVSLAMAVLLLAFAIHFGGRRADLSDQNRGLIAAIGAQSGVKLAALALVAILAVTLLATQGAWSRIADLPLIKAPIIDQPFVSIVFLSMTAMFCFPKQFHVGFVELRETKDIRVARWLVPIYLVLMGLAVAVIAMAGAARLGGTSAPELYVLGLPMAAGQPVLLALAALGAFSAAASMVVVEVVALSAMVSNELVLPWITWRAQRRGEGEPRFSKTILAVRRATMAVVIGAAWTLVLISAADVLTDVGTASFIAAAQLFPLVVGAVFWRRASVQGALAGLSGGMIVWVLCGVLYGVTGEQEAQWTAPLHPVAFSIVTSLGVNVALFVLVSLGARTRMIDRVQAQSFVGGFAEPASRAVSHRAMPSLGATVGELSNLVAHFIGEEGARAAFAEYTRETGRILRSDDAVTPALARSAERMLAGAVGASSARGVIAIALARSHDQPSDVTSVLDDAVLAVAFNRGVLQATLDNLTEGVCVISGEERISAWNARFLELFDLGPDAFGLRSPWWRLRRILDGACVGGQLDLGFSPVDAPRTPIERKLVSGLTLRISHAPMPDGGVVMTFTDITADQARAQALREAAAALEETNETLEQRVAERTRDLAEAKAAAEQADLSKGRFLAAASHDLLQPLHAARLFIGALRSDLEGKPGSDSAAHADQAIATADRMLRALLSLSRLEGPGAEPALGPVDAGELLADLAREFAPSAAAKGLRLRLAPTRLWVSSDRDLLRSVLQNFIVNALAYTPSGGVLLGCRRQGDEVRFEIWDTGPGVSDDDRPRVFDAFVRFTDAPAAQGAGLGLGLSIAQQIARRLGHALSMRSRVGHGSVFAVVAPRTAPATHRVILPPPRQAAPLDGLRVLCVDDEAPILDAMVGLLGRWGASVTRAANWDGVQALGDEDVWEVALVDHHLGEGPSGLDILARLESRIGCAALVTADPKDTLSAAATAAGAALLRKPLDPEKLRTFLAEAYAEQIG